MNFEDSDEEENNNPKKIHYWNNWTPESDPNDADVIPETPAQRSQNSITPLRKLNSFQNSRLNKHAKFKNWMPSNLGKTNVRAEIKLLRLSQIFDGNKARDDSFQNINTSKNFAYTESTNKPESYLNKEDESLQLGVSSGKSNKDGFDINEDWGQRTELHNIFNVNEGDKVWNVINRGLFADIKLCRNEYGHITCKAVGKISVKVSREKSLIEINTEENLRKILNLSQVQWSTLCESVQKNSTLNFSAFQTVDLNKMTSLEKLWFFICKRRHFLPNVCILGKLSGAVKLMKELSIVPKIVVTEIRDIKGGEIT